MIVGRSAREKEQKIAANAGEIIHSLRTISANMTAQQLATAQERRIVWQVQHFTREEESASSLYFLMFLVMGVAGIILWKG